MYYGESAPFFRIAETYDNFADDSIVLSVANSAQSIFFCQLLSDSGLREATEATPITGL